MHHHTYRTRNNAVFMHYSYPNGKYMKLLHRLLKMKCTHTHANNTPHSPPRRQPLHVSDSPVCLVLYIM